MDDWKGLACPFPDSVEGAGLGLSYSIIAFHIFSILLGICLLIYTYIEAKKKLEQIENEMGQDHENSDCSSDYDYDYDYEEPGLNDIYITMPEEYQKKEAKKQLRFERFGSSLSQIREDEDETEEERDSGSSSRNLSDESLRDAARLGARDSVRTQSSCSELEPPSSRSSRRVSSAASSATSFDWEGGLERPPPPPCQPSSP
jgi:hypothetical protein